MLSLSRYGATFPSTVRRWSLTFLVVPLLLSSALVFSSSAQSTASDGEMVVLDPSKVYFGKPKSFNNPAVIKRMKVYKEIPAYQRIKNEKLKPTDPEYHFLIEEASKVFRKNVKKVARARKYDLVAEVQAIAASGRVLPDITKDVIKKIKGQP